jgi:POT family proton-dependent oligopeptide transporter
MRGLARMGHERSLTRMAVESGTQWFGHPRGLATLFFTEMWERFSYYGMRALLVLFLVASVQTGGYGMTDSKAAAIYGLYTATVYLLALPGGWIADRILGQRRAVFLGGCIIAAGHFSMAIPLVPTFYLGLILITIGTGLLKPNVSAMVGDLYPESGARRDAGFSVFYMGINVGALAGPLICGYLGEKVNWHLGFASAGIGMILGLIQYRLGGKYLGDAGQRVAAGSASGSRPGRSLGLGIVALAVIGVALALLDRAGVVNVTLQGAAQATGVLIAGLAVLYFTYVLIFEKLSTGEKKRVFVIFLFFIAATFFWSGFEQAGSSLNLFASRLTDRFLFGWEVPATWLQSVNSIFLILLAPVFGWIWLRLGRRAPSIPGKFGFGLVFLAVGFFVLAWGSVHASDTNKVGMSWLVVVYFFHTIGELCLSPVGLSSVTKLSPRRLVGQMMGTWFMGTALGNLVAGLWAGRGESMPLPQLFSWVGQVTVGGGIVLLLLSPLIRRLIGDPDQPAVPVGVKAELSS